MEGAEIRKFGPEQIRAEATKIVSMALSLLGAVRRGEGGDSISQHVLCQALHLVPCLRHQKSLQP